VNLNIYHLCEVVLKG